MKVADELDANRTTEKSSVVQKEGQRQVSRSSIYYSLDTIIFSWLSSELKKLLSENQ